MRELQPILDDVREAAEIIGMKKAQLHYDELTSDFLNPKIDTNLFPEGSPEHRGYKEKRILIISNIKRIGR